MGEEKAYRRDVEEHSERQGYQRKFRADINKLSWAMLDGGRERRRDKGTGAVARRPDVQKGRNG